MERKDVFISYKAEEFNEAQWVKEVLELNGISCWMAPASIPGGASYASEIPVAIRDCGCFVLILSERAQQSKWVPRELDLAIGANKIVLPFMLENCMLKDDFNFYLTNVQRYRAYESKSAAIEEMILRIKAILSVGGQPSVSAPEAPAPVAEDPTPVAENPTPVVEKPAPAPEAPALVAENPTPVVEKSAPAPEKPAQKVEAPKAKVEMPKAKKKSARKGFPKWLLIVAAALACTVLLCILLFRFSTTEICGKRYARWETSLNLRNEQLDEMDLKGLSILKKLEYASFTDCTFPDDLSDAFSSPLVYLTLENCGLTDTQLRSIDFSRFSLRILRLNGNGEITALESCKPYLGNLYALDISDTGITDLSPLSGCAELQELSADNNGISDLSPLASCPELQTVSLNGNKIADLSAFAACSELEEVYVNGNLLTGLEGLEQALRLEKIHAGSNAVTSLQGLSNATVLTEAVLNGNQLTDVSVLSKSARTLLKLNVSGNPVSDLSFLSTFFELRYFMADNTGIDTLSFLSGCDSIIGVSAAGNRISSTNGIEGKTALQYVNLANNGEISVGAYSPLTFVSSGRIVLDLSGNTLTKANISSTSNYRLLALQGTQTDDLGFVYNGSGERLILGYRQNLKTESFKDAPYYKYMILDCPADRQLSLSEALGVYRTDFAAAASYRYDINEYLPGDMIGG